MPKIGGIDMEAPIMLGAGVCKHPNQLVPYMRSDSPLGAVVSGSHTLHFREGNSGQLAWPADYGALELSGFGLNAYGMPNIGLSEAAKLFPTNPTQPHIVSIAGFNVGEYVEMLDLLKGNKHIAGVELNGGCPNTGHLPVAYMLDDLVRLLEEVSKVGFDLPIWLKLSPYMTAHELEWFASKYPEINFGNTPTVSEGFVGQLCQVLAEYPNILSAVVMTNTVPNVIHGESVTVRNADGSVHHKGGLSGPILREHNLKLIGQMMATGIAANIDIIGLGGILTGGDAYEYLQAGCKGVACTSGPAWSGGIQFFRSFIEGSEQLQDYIVNNF